MVKQTDILLALQKTCDVLVYKNPWQVIRENLWECCLFIPSPKNVLSIFMIQLQLRLFFFFFAMTTDNTERMPEEVEGTRLEELESTWEMRVTE